jgi:hypothetical protein
LDREVPNIEVFLEELTKMLSGSVVIRRMGLMAAVVVMAGCVSDAALELAATPRPTDLLVPTATETATMVVTFTPVATATPVVTATEVPSPTLVPEKYPVSMDKLRCQWTSYEDLLSHLDKCVEAPDPLAGGNSGPEFINWVKNVLIPALGPEVNLPRNARLDSGTDLSKVIFLGPNNGLAKPLMGQPELFYFNHEGKVWPVLVLSLISDIQGVDYDQGTIMAVLCEGDAGWGQMEKLYEGKAIDSIFMYPNASYNNLPDIGKQMIAAGLTGERYSPGSPGTFMWRLPAFATIETLP